MNWLVDRSLGRLLLFVIGVALALPRGIDAEDRRLTTDGRLKDSPVFIDRTGQEIAYVVQESPSLMRLMKLRLADLASQSMTASLDKNEFEPAFSSDGQWMASVQSRGNLSMALVIRQWPSGKEVELKPEGGFCGYRSPSFSPDGQRVFYSFADQDRQSIVSVDRDGNNKTVVVQGPGHANWPTITPDGKHLIFSSSRDGDFEIYDSKLDGSDVRRLTESPRQDVRPRISPDGKRIAFTSARDGNYEIYVMDRDGAHTIRVTHNPERDDYANWHPDSKHLVIVSERTGKHDLHLIALPF